MSAWLEYSVLMRLATTLVWAVAGGCVFLALANSVLLHLKQSRYKMFVVLLIMATILAGSGMAGWLTGLTIWLIIPGFVILIAAIGEVFRIYLRMLYRASQPVARERQQRGFPFVTTKDCVLTRYNLALKAWKGKPFTIAHISDLHVDPRIGCDYFYNVMDRVVEARPDILLIAGDFVPSARQIHMLAPVLNRLAPVSRRYAVLGNHDFWAGPEQVAEAVAQTGIRVLRNETVALELAGGRVLLSGCEDPWGRPLWHAPDRLNNDLLIVMVHTADIVYRLSHANADMAFSGHYHAGQIRIPFIGPVIVPSIYGRRFDHGHFKVGPTDLYVSAGIGAANPPVRLFCHPDIFLVTVSAG